MKATGWAVGVLALAGLAVPADALDIWGRNDRYRNDRYYGRDVGRIAFDRGFEDGARDGSKDGRKGRHYDLRRHDDFRDGDDGYRRQYGPKHLYQRAYRQGYQQGYRRGYESRAYGRYDDRYGRGRGYGRYGDEGYYGNDDDDDDRTIYETPRRRY